MSYEEKYEELLHRIEWCCEGRHGAIRNLNKNEATEVSRALTYFFGGKPNKGQWWKMIDGKYAVEFNHQCKVFPPPKTPWDWCGKTILFKDSLNKELELQKQKSTLIIGSKVSFQAKNQKRTGIIIGCHKRATVLVGSTKWYVPINQLEVINE